MSLYNLMNGFNPACVFMLPMLGKHPDQYPRFRNCFATLEDDRDPEENILVLTRTGGGNREAYEEENQAIREMDYYIRDHDAEFDSTFAIWVFSVPDEWRNDFYKLYHMRIDEVSNDYQCMVRKMYPKISKKLFDNFFGKVE